jgi:hypothetical protein
MALCRRWVALWCAAVTLRRRLARVLNMFRPTNSKHGSNKNNSRKMFQHPNKTTIKLYLRLLPSTSAQTTDP